VADAHVVAGVDSDQHAGHDVPFHASSVAVEAHGARGGERERGERERGGTDRVRLGGETAKGGQGTTIGVSERDGTDEATPYIHTTLTLAQGSGVELDRGLDRDR